MVQSAGESGAASLSVAVVTLFPEMFQAMHAGVIGRAIKQQRISLSYFNPRDFSDEPHRAVDDRPYGGGPGMVMLAEPLAKAIQAAKAKAPSPPKTIYLSPQGKLFHQTQAKIFASSLQPLIFVAGRYEGIDERVIVQEIDEEWSIGDYILTGGELAAMVMIDAIGRLLPHVVQDPASIADDAITRGLLKYPQYTRPEYALNQSVPAVLLSGNHKAIEAWRLEEAKKRTNTRRPDLKQKDT